MNSLSKYLDDTYMTWLGSSLSCCSTPKGQVPTHGAEKPMRIEHYQPRLVPPPIAEPQERPSMRGREWEKRSKGFASRASSRGSFSVRRSLNTSPGPRRPRIGAPSNFRHVEDSMPRRAERLLELSIYIPENRLSPILPHFGDIDDLSFLADDSKDLPIRPLTAQTHSTSESAPSFRIPRKPVRSSSLASSEVTAHSQPSMRSMNPQELLAALETQLPRVPPGARMRSLTEPPAYERVKSALHEKFELEQRLKNIEELIEERRSIYLSSRPTSRARPTQPRSMYAEPEGPMPPTKSPFAECKDLPLADQRPRIAPSKKVHIPTRLKSLSDGSAAFGFPDARTEVLLPPPPLPLVLQPPPRPPLRKKKSFSRVSNWLFPGAEHSRTSSLSSVTNMPKPVTLRDGFYQCFELRQQAPRTSISSASTIRTLESELDEPTVPTTGTPASTPGGVRRDAMFRTLSMDSERREMSSELTRMRTFGEKEIGPDQGGRMEGPAAHAPGRNSVGVAF